MPSLFASFLGNCMLRHFDAAAIVTNLGVSCVLHAAVRLDRLVSTLTANKHRRHDVDAIGCQIERPQVRSITRKHVSSAAVALVLDGLFVGCRTAASASRGLGAGLAGAGLCSSFLGALAARFSYEGARRRSCVRPARVTAVCASDRPRMFRRLAHHLPACPRMRRSLKSRSRELPARSGLLLVGHHDRSACGGNMA